MKSITINIFLCFMLLVGWQVHAQEDFILSGIQNFKVSGTSTLHDWDMIAKEGVKGAMKASLNGSTIKEISELKITLPVQALKSGKSAMDKKAYEALDSKLNPNFYYVLTDVEVISGEEIKAKGKLTIAGYSKEVYMKVGYKVDNGTVTFTGEHPVTFDEFTLEPPSALFNTIKTGNELKIAFKVQFKSIR